MTAPAQIPIQNLYYLLAYAWDIVPDTSDVNLAATRCDDALNLLALMLDRGLRRLTARGFERGYRPRTAPLTRLRGRIDVVDSHRRMTDVAGRMVCRFDELSIDTPANRILRTTIGNLLACRRDLHRDNAAALRRHRDRLVGVSSTRLSEHLFGSVRIHRNNRRYRLPLTVCRLLYRLRMPTTGEGLHRLRDPLDHDLIMHRLFERFVHNFARRHVHNAKVNAKTIYWAGSETWTDEVRSLVPNMRTDVTLERPGGTTILDCKYYRQALIRYHRTERFRPAHLYQLTAYLRNYQAANPDVPVDGLLLYPVVDRHLDHRFRLLDHDVAVRTVDLNRPWLDIHRRLFTILGGNI